MPQFIAGWQHPNLGGTSDQPLPIRDRVFVQLALKYILASKLLIEDASPGALRLMESPSHVRSERGTKPFDIETLLLYNDRREQTCKRLARVRHQEMDRGNARRTKEGNLHVRRRPTRKSADRRNKRALRASPSVVASNYRQSDPIR